MVRCGVHTLARLDRSFQVSALSVDVGIVNGALAAVWRRFGGGLVGEP